MELKKEEVRSNFQQLHGLLVVRETFLLREMDEVVSQVRQAITEKRTNLQQLYTARESSERDLTKNKFKKLLEKQLRAIEDEIGEEVARSVNVGWMELDWKIEQLEQSVIEVCKVVTLNERPLTRIDYSARKCPVWSSTLTQTFTDVRLTNNQLLCLIKISNSSKESNSELLKLTPIRVQEVSNCMKIRCMSCLVTCFPLFLSLYRYLI